MFKSSIKDKGSFIRSSRRSSKLNSSASSKSGRIEGKVKLAELLAQEVFRKAPAGRKWNTMAEDAGKTCYGKDKSSNPWECGVWWRTGITRKYIRKSSTVFAFKANKKEDSEEWHCQQDSDYLNPVHQVGQEHSWYGGHCPPPPAPLY